MPLICNFPSWCQIKRFRKLLNYLSYIKLLTHLLWYTYCNLYLCIFYNFFILLRSYLNVFVSIYLSTYIPLSVCLSIFFCSSFYRSIFLSIYLYVYLPINLSMCLSAYQSIYVSICHKFVAMPCVLCHRSE